MKIDKSNVLIVGRGTENTRQLGLPGVVARHLRKGAYALGGLLLALLVFVAIRGGGGLHMVALREENQLLTEELERMRDAVDRIDGEIGTLARQDRTMRKLAGLVEIDPEVFEVGIGGPGLASPAESPLWAHDPRASEASYAINYDLATLTRKAELLERSFIETEASFQGRYDLMRATPTMPPGFGPISSGFSDARRHPVYGGIRPHGGIDQTGPVGEPFVATGDGRVVFAGWRLGYGYTIEIDHGFGLSSLYAHASRLLVSRGERVRRAQPIGEIGCTGVCTGPHVHYEVRVNGSAVNPMDYILLPIDR